MSDTLQIVRWSLEFTCPLRPPEASRDPVRALRAISDAHSISRSVTNPSDDFGIKGDVFVTGCTVESVPKSLCPEPLVAEDKDEDSGLGFLQDVYAERGSTALHFPTSGFLIPDTFAAVGGIDGLLSLCRACPANTLAPHPAGCAGTIFVYPNDDELQEELAETIRRRGLQDRIDEVFQRTSPIWFGLWARSPLGPTACEVLDLLLGELVERMSGPGRLDRWDSETLDDIRAFQRATRVSRKHRIALHASMAPPGHCDFGWSTTFAHCPRCKAEADLPRWKRRYPNTPYTCNVCGQEYTPSDTASSERDDEDFATNDLRKLLGSERFNAFAIRFLTDRGLSRENATMIVERLNEEQRARETRLQAEGRRDAQREQYIQTVLYAGLHPSRPPGAEQESRIYFSADEFVELIRRCRLSGATIAYMFQESADDELCPRERVQTDAARQLLDRWKERGCNEWFGAIIGVPDCVLDAPPVRF